jgi:uncharacterized protein YqiB (DUF1249 family)
MAYDPNRVVEVLNQILNTDLKVDEKERIKEAVYSLTPQQAAQAWKMLYEDRTGVYKGLRRSFCLVYSLSELSFKQWLKNKINYSPAMNAVRHFLLDEGNDSSPDFIIKPSELMQRIEQQSEDIGALNGVVFIDGDNAISCLDSIHQFMVSKEMNDFLGLHIVTIMKKDSYSSKFLGFELKPWFSILQTSDQLKGSVDIFLTFCVAKLDSFVKNLDIPFFIVSHDHFAEQACQAVVAWKSGRKCIPLNQRSVNVAEEISSILSGNNSSLYYRYIEPKEITDEEKRIIRKSEIKIEIPVTVEDDPTIDDLELITYYSHYWVYKYQGTHAAFCRKYCIDSSNFSKWRRNLTKSRASRRAVLQFMADEGIQRTSKWQNLTIIKEVPKLEDSDKRSIVVTDDGTISDEILRRIYEEYWVKKRKGKHSLFAGLYSINNGNFSQWRRNLARSPASRKAVLQFIKDEEIDIAQFLNTSFVQDNHALCHHSPHVSDKQTLESIERVGEPQTVENFEDSKKINTKEVGRIEILSVQKEKANNEESVYISDDKLREIYDEYWTKKSKRHADFCNLYKIDPGNFSKWRRNLAKSPASRNAVLLFIKDQNIRI